LQDSLTLISIIVFTFQNAMFVTSNAVGMRNDIPLRMEFKGSKTSISLVRLDQTNLIVAYKNKINKEKIDESIDNAAELLRKVLTVVSNLQDTGTNWTLR
jgi:hypothetical protein